MKALYCFAALAFTTALTAEDAVYPTTKKEMITSIPHVWVSADLLYLRAQEGRIAYANAPETVSAGENYDNKQLLKPHFNWNAGIRLDAGYQPKEWIFYGNWTYIQNTANAELQTSAGKGFFPIWTHDEAISTTDYATASNSQWRLYLNMVDLGAAYPWKPNDWFILKPHVALRGAYLGQRQDVTYGGGYFNEGIDFVHMKNTFFGMGPLVGFTPSFGLGKGFSLIGDLSASALMGGFYIKQRERYLDESLFYHKHDHAKLRFILDAKAALSWEREILYKAMKICVQAGWEWHKFYDQNQLSQNEYAFFNGSRDLILRGGFISLCLGF